MKLENFFHLSYCTNIHPGESWQETYSALCHYLPSIKESVASDQKFGIGLRLSARAVTELLQNDQLSKFKSWLEREGLYVFTINGFPYGGFHGVKVKDQVHAPDWTTTERRIYTEDLFRLLSELLQTEEGSISTSPISYRYWFHTEADLHTAKLKAVRNLAVIAVFLNKLEHQTGKYLHLDLEPEPDGVLENSEEMVDFFINYLIPEGVQVLVKQQSISEEEAEKILRRHIQVCYDVCHFALGWEEPEETISKFEDFGIQIGKVQISAALEARFSENIKDQVLEELKNFDEPTYLHQVTVNTASGLQKYPDLPEALEKAGTYTRWRIHFHVPVFLESYKTLYSTRKEIEKVISLLKEKRFSRHLEIETYTWEVLPESLKGNLEEMIVREIEWVKQSME